MNQWIRGTINNIVSDLSDRSGCPDIEYGFDDETRDEIKEKWAKIVEKHSNAKIEQLVAIKKKAKEYMDADIITYQPHEGSYRATWKPAKEKLKEELQQLIAEYEKEQDDAPKHELDWPNDSCCFYREK